MRTLAVVVLVVTGSCTPQPQPYGAPSQQYGAAPQYGAAQAPAAPQGGVGCLDLMRCYGNCPGLAQNCTSACDASGTPAAAAVNATVFQCIAQNQCADEDCITSRCAAQLQTCVATPGAQDQVAQQPTYQPPPPQQQGGAIQTAPNLPPVPDSQFVFRGADGLDYVPDLKVVAQGVPVALEGVWADTKRNFSIELSGSTYVTTFAPSSAYFQSGTTTTERGTWSLSGTTFTMTPQTFHLGATRKLHQEREDQQIDPPRSWSLVGATLEFTKFGDPSHAVYRVDGLMLSGTPPSWDNVGAFSYVVRRAN